MVFFLPIPDIGGKIVRLMAKQARKSESSMNTRNFIITQHKFTMWLGIIVSVIFAAIITLMLIFPDDAIEAWLYVVSLVFLVAGLLLAYYVIRWKITIEEDSIIVTPVFGKQIIINFREISKATYEVVEASNSEKVYSESVIVYDANGKKLFSIELICIGFSTFLKRLNEENIPLETVYKKTVQAR